MFKINFGRLYSMLMTDEFTIRNFNSLRPEIVRNYNERFLEVLKNAYFLKKDETGKTFFLLLKSSQVGFWGCK